MNLEGRSLLRDYGFNPPHKDQVLGYDEISKVDLDNLYFGNRCGISIDLAPADMRVFHGPNYFPKISGAHNIPQERFLEEWEKAIARAQKLGYNLSEVKLVVCQSVPQEVTIAGTCARVEERDGIGYLSCECLNNVRRGDFTPDKAITYKIVGGRPIGATRAIATQNELPFWVIAKMYDVMTSVNRFELGLMGVEFVLDKQTREIIFHDMYWSQNTNDFGLRSKFGVN